MAFINLDDNSSNFEPNTRRITSSGKFGNMILSQVDYTQYPVGHNKTMIEVDARYIKKEDISIFWEGSNLCIKAKRVLNKELKIFSEDHIKDHEKESVRTYLTQPIYVKIPFSPLNWEVLCASLEYGVLNILVQYNREVTQKIEIL